MQEFSDNELVQKYLGGRQEALDLLIQRYFKQIFFFSKGYVKQDLEAEDVTQEVFVKLWKYIKKFDQEKKFKTWLFQIAKNTCIDFLRKNKNLLPAQGLDEEHMAMELENLVDKNPLPQELLDSEHFAKKLDEILNTLPKPQKITVTLYLQNDLTFQEIAEVLNEPLNTVKSRYRRALLYIRNNLENLPELKNKAPTVKPLI